MNEIDPFTWLDDVLERMVGGTVKANGLDQLLGADLQEGGFLIAPLKRLASIIQQP